MGGSEPKITSSTLRALAFIFSNSFSASPIAILLSVAPLPFADDDFLNKEEEEEEEEKDVFLDPPFFSASSLFFFMSSFVNSPKLCSCSRTSSRVIRHTNVSIPAVSKLTRELLLSVGPRALLARPAGNPP